MRSKFFKPRTNRPIGYTIVEMLVVVGIIAVLLSMTVPAIQGLARSSGRRAAVNTVMAVFDQARALALSQRRPSYVVFGTELTMTDDTRFKSVAIFQDQTDATIPPVMVSKWISLPQGICFKNVNPSFVSAPTKSFTCGSTTRTLPYVKFNSTGSVLEPTNPALLQVLFFQGFTATNGTQISTNSQQASIPQEKITVSFYTGRAKFDGT